MKLRLLVSWGIAAFAAAAAAADVELTGVMTHGGQTKLAFRDTQTGVSRWVDLGGEVGGYTVTSFDEKDQSVVLTKSGETARMKLNAARPPQKLPPDSNSIAALEEAIRRSPSSGQLEFLLGQILRDNNRRPEAFIHFVAALRKGNLEKPMAVHQLVAYGGYELDEYETALRSISILEMTEEGKKDAQLPQLRKAIESARNVRAAQAGPVGIRHSITGR